MIESTDRASASSKQHHLIYVPGLHDMHFLRHIVHGNDVLDANLQQKDWDAIYQEMYRRIQKALKAGKTVVHDTGNFTKHERGLVRAIADKLGLETVTVFVDTPQEVAKQRLIANRKTNERFNVTDQEFEEAVAEMEIPVANEHTIKYTEGTPVESWIEEYFNS